MHNGYIPINKSNLILWRDVFEGVLHHFETPVAGSGRFSAIAWLSMDRSTFGNAVDFDK